MVAMASSSMPECFMPILLVRMAGTSAALSLSTLHRIRYCRQETLELLLLVWSYASKACVGGHVGYIIGKKISCNIRILRANGSHTTTRRHNKKTHHNSTAVTATLLPQENRSMRWCNLLLRSVKSRTSRRSPLAAAA
jgi:hypothetical protein